MLYLAEKIIRKLKDYSTTLDLLIHGHQLPKYEGALDQLQQISPDLGGGCITKREPSFENRTIPLSVIVPAYNVEKYVVNCMESILQQDTTFEYEVIVVNDGSTDTTAALLRQYEQDKRVHVIHQQNGGLSAARNTGIAVSRGEYLCFVDSDDALSTGALEALMSITLRECAKLVIGSYERYCTDGTVRYTTKLADQKVTDLNLPGFAPGKVIHYSAFRTLCFPEGYWFEDSIMAQIVHPLFQTSACTISHVCYRYFVNETGITSSAKGKRKSLDSLWITMRLLEERKAFQLPYTQHSYGYFLSMVNLTYHRTKALGPEIAKCVFSVQRMLMDKYYADYRYEDGGKKRKIEEALRSNHFRKYVLACERKN